MGNLLKRLVSSYKSARAEFARQRPLRLSDGSHVRLGLRVMRTSGECCGRPDRSVHVITGVHDFGHGLGMVDLGPQQEHVSELRRARGDSVTCKQCKSWASTLMRLGHIPPPEIADLTGG